MPTAQPPHTRPQSVPVDAPDRQLPMPDVAAETEPPDLTHLARHEWALDCAEQYDLTGPETYVLIHVAHRAGPKYGYRCFESQENIAARLRLGHRTVKRALGRLVKLGLLASQGSFAGPNAYIIRPALEAPVTVTELGRNPDPEPDPAQTRLSEPPDSKPAGARRRGPGHPSPESPLDVALATPTRHLLPKPAIKEAPAAPVEEDSARRLWSAVAGDLQMQVSRPTFDTWLKGVYGSDLTGDQLTIMAPNTFVAEMIDRRMHDLVEEAVERVAKRPLQVRISAPDPHEHDQPPPVPEAEPRSTPSSSPAEASRSSPAGAETGSGDVSRFKAAPARRRLLTEVLPTRRLWSLVLEDLEMQVNATTFAYFLRGLVVDDLTGDQLTIIAPNTVIAERIDTRMRNLVEEMVERHFKRPLTLKISLPADDLPPLVPEAEPRSTPASSPDEAPRPSPAGDGELDGAATKLAELTGNGDVSRFNSLATDMRVKGCPISPDVIEEYVAAYKTDAVDLVAYLVAVLQKELKAGGPQRALDAVGRVIRRRQDQGGGDYHKPIGRYY